MQIMINFDGRCIILCSQKTYIKWILILVKKVKLAVRNPLGKQLEIAISVSETVLDLKKMIEEKTGFAPDIQRLICESVRYELEDDKRLSEYNVTSETSIVVVPYLSGGVASSTSGSSVNTHHSFSY